VPKLVIRGFAAILAAVLVFAQDRDFSEVQIKVTKVAGTIYMLGGTGRNIGSVATDRRAKGCCDKKRDRTSPLCHGQIMGNSEAKVSCGIVERGTEVRTAPRRKPHCCGLHLGRKVHATQQVLEARLGPQLIEQRINFHKDHERISSPVSPLQAAKGFVLPA
jgi:hypothetical protein